MATSRIANLERLERRACMSVTASVTDGNPVVEGDTDGPVVIRGLEPGKFEVSDNGVVVATLEGVAGGLRIALDTGGAGHDDTVTVDLAGQAVDRVFAELGNGRNELLLRGGTVGGLLRFRGGTGDDTVTLAPDATVGGETDLQLGEIPWPGHGRNQEHLAPLRVRTTFLSSLYVARGLFLG